MPRARCRPERGTTAPYGTGTLCRICAVAWSGLRRGCLVRLVNGTSSSETKWSRQRHKPPIRRARQRHKPPIRRARQRHKPPIRRGSSSSETTWCSLKQGLRQREPPGAGGIVCLVGSPASAAALRPWAIIRCNQTAAPSRIIHGLAKRFCSENKNLLAALVLGSRHQARIRLDGRTARNCPTNVL